MVTETRTGQTILVVEDNDIARTGLSVILQKAGYRVIAAANGRQALEYFRAARPPDLVLLDMLMPVLDGWHFLDALRRWPRPVHVPIVVATGTILTREWANQHGCVGFLRKPFETSELLAEVKRCLDE